MDYRDQFPASLRVFDFFRRMSDLVLEELLVIWPTLTENQARVILYIDEPIAMKELASRVGMQPSNATKLVVTCEKQGLVRREKSAEDARSVMVQLTPSGEEFRTQMLAQVTRIVDEVVGLEERNYEAIFEIIRHKEYLAARPRKGT